MLDLTFTTELTEEEQKVILNGLGEHASEKATIKKDDVYIPFQSAYKDQKGHIKAGLIGYCYYQCLYIDMFWVHLDYRNKKLGTILMNKAENFGKKAGCLFSTVNTMDWEVPEFYRKVGYELEFIREGYMDNHKMYFFRKNLI